MFRFRRRSAETAPSDAPSRIARPLLRGGLVTVSAIAVLLALGASAMSPAIIYYVECQDSNSGIWKTAVNCGDMPCPTTDSARFYSLMETSGTAADPLKLPESTYYAAEGIKGTIDTNGNPAVPDLNTQHIVAALTSVEDPYNSNTGCSQGSTSYPDCHVQIGWQLGFSNSCGTPFYPSTPQVYVEVFDDSEKELNGSQSCGYWQYGAAPQGGASYDTRYYSSLVAGSPSQTFYRYKAYYQYPNQQCCQVLAYGDFQQQMTGQQAGTEAAIHPYSDGDPSCPVVAQPGSANNFGAGTNPATFAAELQLRTSAGTWVDWNSSSVAGIDFNTTGSSGYLLTPSTNFQTFGAKGPIQ